LHKYLFVICDENALLIIIVSAKARYDYISQEYEICYDIDYNLPVTFSIIFLEGYEVGHEESYIEEAHDYQ